MVKIQQDLIKDTNYKYGKSNVKKKIVIHQTGNTGVGADADAHARLQELGNRRPASWHIQVDDKKAIQSFDFDFQLWHAGDAKGEGNLNGIAIEMCINQDGDYKKTIENTVDVVKQLMKKFDISIKDVKQHNHFSGKDCPKQLRAGKDGITWNDFIDMVKDTGKSAPSKKKPVKKTTKKQTNSIVDYLNERGMDASYNARRILAVKHRIRNYRGTAEQNLELLDKLRNKVNATSKKKVYTKGSNETSIVDFLNKNGKDSSYEARKEIAKNLGIKGYRGTAKQNVELLETLKKM